LLGEEIAQKNESRGKEGGGKREVDDDSRDEMEDTISCIIDLSSEKGNDDFPNSNLKSNVSTNLLLKKEKTFTQKLQDKLNANRGIHQFFPQHRLL